MWGHLKRSPAIWTSGYPPQELLAALLTLDGASLTSGEVEELRRTCLAQGGTQESPGGTSPAGAR